MATDNRKWYVVWQGTEPGICDSWAECELRVKGYPGARYKAFNSQQEAVEAFRNDPGEMDILRAIARAPREFVNYEAIPGIVRDSIAVDGACSGNPGIMEYRGVDVPTGVELFHQGPFPDATNNIGEFLLSSMPWPCSITRAMITRPSIVTARRLWPGCATSSAAQRSIAPKLTRDCLKSSAVPSDGLPPTLGVMRCSSGIQASGVKFLLTLAANK